MVSLNLVLDLNLFPNAMGWMLDKRDAMERLYVSTQKRIFDFLIKYTHNSDTAMDLLQDTFLSYFKAYGDSEMTQEQSTMLLYRIARNRSINHSKKFATKNESALGEDFFIPDKRNFAKDIEKKDMELKLLECLDELTSQEKEAVLLKYVEDLSLSQIASILEVSISTVSRTIAKATVRILELAKEKEISLH